MPKIRSVVPSAAVCADQEELEALRQQVARLTRENEKQRRRLEFLVHLVALLRSGSVDLSTRSQLVQDNHQLGIRWLCQILRMDRRSLYRWRRERDGLGRRAAADQQVVELIMQIHAASGGTYGAARVTAALRHRGLVVNRKRVARIMREHGIRGVSRRKRRSLTRPDGAAPSAPDLLGRNFTAPAPGLRIVGDITCVPTGEGWLYLAVLLDLCTREIIGWVTAARRNASLVIRALSTAANNRRLAKGAILHSDRGVEYTCAAYRHEIARIGARQSLHVRVHAWTTHLRKRSSPRSRPRWADSPGRRDKRPLMRSTSGSSSTTPSACTRVLATVRRREHVSTTAHAWSRQHSPE